MRAVLLLGHGGFEQLEFRVDVPVPQPAAGEVLIRIGAAGVNNTDINTRTGWYADAIDGDAGWTGAKPQFPRIQGADGCGHIVAVGAGVDPQRIGERVLIEPVFRLPGDGLPGHGKPGRVGARESAWLRAVYFGSEHDGAFAEYATVPAAHAHRIRCGLSDVELASFPCSYSAAENMLTRLALQAGASVLITGASGGVGSAAVQLAKRRGATVYAVAGTAKAAAVAALGADRVFARDADLLAQLGRESIDAVIDVVGGAPFGSLLELLRRGGGYAAAGAIGGAVVSLDLRTLYLKDLRLLGCTVLEPQVFPNLIGYIERGEIRPVIASVHPLSAIVAAQAEFLTKRHTGKIVLVP
jgi:NADPH:quinone reductase-like Zn-dependent oxidoreductase